ncbi:MAG: hypothetical protein MJA83_08290, partial [Gammaproteobacteria bacterium]|nr:hypothetical protein [Gammaproteobacteria bacterium]
TGMIEEAEQYVVPDGVPVVATFNGVGNIGTEQLRDQLCNEGDVQFDFCNGRRAGAEPPSIEAPSVSVAGNLVTKTVNTLAKLTTNGAGGKIEFPYINESTVDTFNLANGALFKREVTDFSYNGTGDATGITVTTSNGSNGDVHSVQTTNTYGQNDTAKWCLGRLTRTSVVHAAPGTPNQTRVSSFSYDTNTCQLISETIEPDSGTEWLTKTYAFDVFGNRIKETVTGAGIAARSTLTAYDEFGLYPALIVNALGHKEDQNWDARFGVQTLVTGPNGLTTAWDYDNFGRRIKETGSPNTIFTDITREWCVSNCGTDTGVYKVTTTGSDGSQGFVVYDKLDREVQSASQGLNGQWSYVDTYYDPLGRAYLSTTPHHKTSGAQKCWVLNKFDGLGRPVEARGASSETQCVAHDAAPLAHTDAGSGLSAVTTTSYDKLTTVSVDAEGRAQARISNVAGRLIKVEERDPANTNNVLQQDGVTLRTTFVYDAVGNTKEVQPPGTGNNVTMGYDLRGNKTSMSDPDMGNWVYDYNTLGELVSQTDAKSQITEMDYDLLGRLVERRDLAGTVNEAKTNWHYDTAYGAGTGKLAYVFAPDGYSEAVAYDELGRPTDTIRVVDDELYWTSQTYDNQSRVKDLVYPDIEQFDVATPPAPPALNDFTVPASSTTGQYAISWTTSGTTKPVYRLYRNTSGTFNENDVIYAGPLTSYNENLGVDGTYSYWLKVCQGGNCSATVGPKATAVTIPPQAPAYVSARDTVSYDGDVTIAWDGYDDNIGKFRFYEGLTSNISTKTMLAEIDRTTAREYEYTAADRDTHAYYYYWVEACKTDGSGNATSCSAAQPADYPVEVKHRPESPLEFTFDPPVFSPNGDFNISWNASSSPHKTRYELWEATNREFTGETQVTLPSALATSVSLSRTNDEYFYRLRVCNNTICSEFEAFASYFVQPPPSAVTGYTAWLATNPGQPGNPVIPGVVSMTWLPSTAGSAGAEIAYQIFRTETPTIDWDNPGPVFDTVIHQGNVTHAKTYNLGINGDFYFHIRACHGLIVCSGGSS